MFLKELLEGTTVAGDYPQADICDIVYDSRKARPGTVFVCMKGETTDGHKYAKSAYDLGCRVFVAEEALSLPDDAIVLMSENTRRDLAQMSINFFGHPADELKMIGITGTKGKTSITYILRSALENCGIKQALSALSARSTATKKYRPSTRLPNHMSFRKFCARWRTAAARLSAWRSHR